MNKASKLISRSVQGKRYKNIELGRRWFRVYQPTINRICKILEHWSDIDLAERITLDDVVKNKKDCIRGLSHALGSNAISRAYYTYWLNRSTGIQLLEATAVVLSVMGAEDFFQSASLMKNATLLIASPK